MKKTYLVLASLAFTCVSFFADAQTLAPVVGKRSCASVENLNRQIAEGERSSKSLKDVETQVSSFAARTSYASLSASSTVLTIPVVVNVIYNTAKPKENISDAQIQSQIAVLNEDYRKLNSDVSKTPTEFAGRSADIKVQFQLVKINRKASTKTSWGTRDAMKKSKQGGIDPTTPATHLNMWVCEIGGGILGYAQFPGGALATDGVVMSPQYFGSSKKGTGFYLAAPYDLGRTATHEVGHWMNLRHIWGDATCGDDFVSDTPTASAANYGCPTYPKVGCSNNMMTMNYMDYSDDACMYMFTQGQAVRMRAIFAAGGARATMGGSGFVAREEATQAFSANDIEVYPNPATKNATLRVNIAKATDLTISVTDIQGRVVSTTSFNQISGSLEHNIDLEGLNNGMYLVNINGESVSEVKKLFVVK